uniref:Probable cytosolic iron-sulfur protein assembly protein CIAO1 homolog n=1 Tax=Setaria digitata TaxID=48799 RepID=A0A915PSQ2_9BILA
MVGDINKVIHSCVVACRVWCVQWNHAGTILASCGDDKTIKFWKIADDVPYLIYSGTITGSHSRAIRHIAFSPDDKFLASAGFDGAIVVYQICNNDYEEVNRLEGHENEVKCCAFSPSGEYLATCSRDKSVWFWQLDEDQDFEVASILQSHTQDVKFVVWHPIDELLVSCSYDCSVRFYRFDGEDWITQEKIDNAHDSTVWSADFSDDGNFLVTVGADFTINIWMRQEMNSASSKCKWNKVTSVYVKTKWPLYSVSWNKLHGIIAVGGGDSKIRLYRLNNSADSAVLEECFESHKLPSEINCLNWNPVESCLLTTATDDGEIYGTLPKYEKIGQMSALKGWAEPLHMHIILMSQNVKHITQLKEIISEIGAFEKKSLKVGHDIAEHRVEVDDYGNPWIELHLDVMSSCWKRTLFKMVSIFQTLTSTFVGRNAPILQAAESGFFMDDCLSAELQVSVSSIHHGNLLDPGTFYSHFTRNIPEQMDETKFAEYIRLLSKLSVRYVHTPMYADFEHDRNIFTVRFSVLDGYKPRESANIEKVAEGSVYAVKVRYTSLRRILVDTKAQCEGTHVTRIYFHLNYPPEIRRFRQKLSTFREQKMDLVSERFRYYPESDDHKSDGNMAITAINDSPVFCLQFTKMMDEDGLYRLLSRLHARIGLPIEFANVEFFYFPIDSYVALPVRIIGCDYRKCASEEGILQNNKPYVPIEPKVDSNWSKKLRSLSFGLEYLIAALLSRGAIKTIEARDDFLMHVVESYEQDEAITLEVLERLINMVDEMKNIPPFIPVFDRIRNSIFEKKDLLAEIHERSAEEGFQRVRKAVITPTRMLLVVPELLMGNRVLREFDESGDGALRIQFRDDDGTHLRRSSAGPYIIETTVHNCLLHGIYISSEMRDNGCYFFNDGDNGKVKKIREKLGKFDSTNIPKLMSRMGQCFTQSKESDVILKRKRYNKTYDVIGGKDSCGEPFIFSDGVGKLSEDFAQQIAKDLGLGKCVPSCFQFRHRGLKGVLSVDPALRQRRVWAEKNGVEDKHGKTEKVNDLDVLFRPSQDKFHAPRKEIIEIVKYSSPTPVCLNRPLINILDQVSDMQGFDVHSRITRRIHGLLDRQLMHLSDSLMSENKCRERLAEFPRRVNVHYLSVARGFTLTQEPFFHSLLIASVRFTLQKQLTKEQIQIPTNLGRTMFGILDETGLLQYGQIFVQFTNNVSLKTPSKAAAKTILKGPVLVTKNPSIVAGDVRVFEALDLLELRHLVDVVVFPQHGPRPHTDEMAGSDLDGDEYSVIWDDQMLFDHNEEPMDFSKLVRPPDVLKEDDVVREMRRFYVEYIKQDSIGAIANAFLVNSDLFGVTSDVCINIAEKHSQSVDFPKTGRPPKPLIRDWSVGPDGKSVPPERPEHWPDFMCKTHEPSYVSTRLVGQLFRRIRLVHDVLTITSAHEKYSQVIPDPLLEYSGWESYEDDAKLNLNAYSAHVKALMDNYGIQDEGQLFSSCFSKIRNRISDRDTDDMSQFNTNFIIERKLTNIFMSFRCNFFVEFGGFISSTEPEEDFNYKDVDERRYCKCPTVQMKKKASAYYIVCYRKAMKRTDQRLLSFPWIAWDILADIKKDNCVLQSQNTLTIDPLCDHISNVITCFSGSNEEDFDRTVGHLTEGASGLHAIKRYCRKYKGLDKLFYVLCKWGEQQRLFEGRLKREHLCLLLLQYGLGYISGESIRNDVFLEQTDEILPENSDEIHDLDSLIGGIGKCFLRFLQYLSSRSFETMKIFNFMQPNLGYQSILMRGQWFELHQAAVKTFYRIVLTSRFDELSLYEVEEISANSLSVNFARNSFAFAISLNVFIETEPFTIELPEDLSFYDNDLRNKMIRYSGVRHLYLRRIPEKKNRVMVSAFGTLESLHRLRDLLAVKPTLNTQADNKTRSDMMLRLVYERIRELS